MSKITNWNSGDKVEIIRGKVNTNFSNLNSDKLEASQVLTKTNVVSYTPSTSYNPATKGYVDESWVLWGSVYNPQSISADIFDRGSHTGLLDPEDIDLDTTHRWTTDSEKGIWNGMEPAFTKGTGFNKDFGTAAGTVAEGNHTHTKAELGLTYVDNTRDVDKVVSSVQQTALDLKADQSSVNNVDNVSDADKPVSTAQQAAINLRALTEDVTAAIVVVDENNRSLSNLYFGGSVDSGNYSKFDETTGSLSFHGTATVWDDLVGSLIGKRLSATTGKVDYDWSENAITFQSGGSISTEADIINFNFQYPHAAIEDGEMRLHVHWEQPDSTEREFTVKHRIQSNGEAKTTSWTTTVVTCNSTNNVFTYSSGTLNQITELVNVDMEDAGISATVQFQLARTDSETGDITVTFVDAHIELDSAGSETEYVK